MEMEYAAAAVDAAVAAAATSSGAAVLAAVHEDEGKWPEGKHLFTTQSNSLQIQDTKHMIKHTLSFSFLL
jgi:hypothetical protein